MSAVQNRSLSALDLIHAYGKIAVQAHQKTNCITELLLPEAETWAQSEVNLNGPLAGVPVSLKDSVQVKGFDISLGYTRLAGKPYTEDGPMVKLLKDAGGCYLFFIWFCQSSDAPQEPCPTRKQPSPSPCSPLNPQTRSGARVAIPTSPNTPPAGRRAAKERCWPSEGALVLARTLQDRCACRLHGVGSTRCAVVRADGPRRASTPAWRARRAWPACSAPWRGR